MSEELKPCPRCGSPITRDKIWCYEDIDGFFYYVSCGCHSEPTECFLSKKEAIEAWNKRAIPKVYVKLDDVIKIIKKYAPARRGIRGQEVSAEDIYEPIFIRMKKEIIELGG